LAEGFRPGQLERLEKRIMQCVDCHNRPAHSFEMPKRAVNAAIASGAIPASLPFIRGKSVDVLKSNYASREEAERSIPAAIRQFYEKEHPEVASKSRASVERAGRTLADIYLRNVFPDLKIGWGSYQSHLGHTDSPGCFRCHDGLHKSTDGKTIGQDCSACHELVAMDEADPKVLETLGVGQRRDQERKR
jgi:hypothetical protein